MQVSGDTVGEVRVVPDIHVRKVSITCTPPYSHALTLAAHVQM